ncbi:MAG: hypothetical protein WCG27_03380 [Pseudomonadota bacterium]
MSELPAAGPIWEVGQDVRLSERAGPRVTELEAKEQKAESKSKSKSKSESMS